MLYNITIARGLVIFFLVVERNLANFQLNCKDIKLKKDLTNEAK